MARILPLSDAVAELIHDGDEVACEGFTHLIPFAAGHEIIRQRKKNLTLIRMTPDLIYDQMIGMGVAAKLVFSWGGNPGVGSLHRLRDAVEREWPLPLVIEELSHAGMVQAYNAGAAGLPFGILRGFTGTDLPKVNRRIKDITCPFTGELLAAVPAIRPDVAVIHAQKADRNGNVLIWGIIGVQKEVVLAAKRSIVTVEEIVDRLDPSPNACILPGWLVSAICLCPGGAYPSYAQGYYDRDNRFYQSWDGISRSRDEFLAWMKTNLTSKSVDTDFRDRFRKSIEPPPQATARPGLIDPSSSRCGRDEASGEVGEVA
jgi:glutaconate CoA-transferase subunit A